jgi:hypothetical protein
VTLDAKALRLPPIPNETTDINKLMLAEHDMDKWKLYEETRRIAFEVCLTMENILRVAAMHHNRFVSISDTNDEELILFVSEGQAFVPKCLKLNNTLVTFDEENLGDNMCDLDVPISFSVAGKPLKGYLDFNNIISHRKSRRCVYPCDMIDQVHYFKRSAKILKRRGLVLNLLDNSEKLLAKPLKFGEISFSKLNFRHSQSVLDGNDILKEFKSLNSQVDQRHGNIGGDNQNQNVMSESMLDGKKIRKWFDSVKYVFLYPLIISVIVLAAYLLVLWLSGKVTLKLLTECWLAIKYFLDRARKAICKRGNLNRFKIEKKPKIYQKRIRVESIGTLDDLVEMIEFKKAKLDTVSKASQTESKVAAEFKMKVAKASSEYASVKPSDVHEYKELENEHKYVNEK